MTFQRNLLSVCCALLLPLSMVEAQEFVAEKSQITANSNVRIHVRSGPGTSRSRLELLTESIGGAMGKVRACYGKVGKDDPTVQGSMKMLIAAASKGLDVTVRSEDHGSKKLTKCVVKALKKTQTTTTNASAFVKLDFSNTAAAGVERTRTLREKQAKVDVGTNDKGKHHATGGTADNLVSFRVSAQGRTLPDTVAEVQRKVRRSIPKLLDCRRKAAHRQSDPRGDITSVVSIKKGRGKAKITKDEVANPRGSRCVKRALSRVKYGKKVTGRVMVVVHFDARPSELAPPPETAPKKKK